MIFHKHYDQMKEDGKDAGNLSDGALADEAWQ